MYSAIIKKKKKDDLGSAIEATKGIYKPMDLKTTPIEHKPMDFKTPPIKAGLDISAKKPKSEDVLSIDLAMQSAKKKSDKNNATSSEGEDFKVNKNKEGMWTESGLAKEAYLKKIKKLKGN